MSSEGVIRIKGDNTDLDRKTQQSVQNMQQLGQHASTAHGHAKNFGQVWEHANNRMVRTVAHAASIAGALHLAVEVLHEFQEASEKASKAVGTLAMQEAAITRKTGVAPEKLAGYLGVASPVSRKDLTEYAGELASMNRVGRAERKVTEKEFSQAMTARAAGYDPAEIHYALEKGRLPELVSTDITKGMTEEQLAERRTKIFENNRENAAEEARAAGGLKNRQAGAAYDAASAGTIFDIWGLKTVLGVSARLQGTGTEGNERTGGTFAGVTGYSPSWKPEGETKKAIEDQTAALKPPPTLAREAH